MPPQHYFQFELRTANGQLDNIVKDQIFTLALLSKFRCFSCLNLRWTLRHVWFELKIKKTNPSQWYMQNLSPKTILSRGIYAFFRCGCYALYVKYGPIFPSINADHRTSRMNTDPSAYKGNVSYNALSLIFRFLWRAEPWNYQDIIQMMEL
jgi:hypothetical protein